MSRVVVLGSSNTDLVLRADRLPAPGETILANEYEETQGGKGANQAVAAARAGGTVTFIASIGGDAFGRVSLKAYASEGIDCSQIITDSTGPSGLAMIWVDGRGENMIAVHSGANASMTSNRIDGLPGEIFNPPGIFVTQLEMPVPAVRRALERAKSGGLFTVLNPAPADPILGKPDILKLVDLLIPNEIELSLLADSSDRGKTTSTEDAARALLDQGAGRVLVTLGSQGSVYFSIDDRDSMNRIPIEASGAVAVDTVAAGDCFVGVLAAELAIAGKQSDEAILKAARRASVAASISVGRRGAQDSLPTRKEIDQVWKDRK